MDVRRVDIFHVQIVELAVLGFANLDNRRARTSSSPYTPTVISVPSMHFSTSTLSPYANALAIARGQLGGLMDQGNAIAGTVDGRLHKAALATNLDDMIDIDFIAHLEREAGGNGNARLGVQELRDLLVGTAGAGKHAEAV